jgi:hypothetical protein
LPFGALWSSSDPCLLLQEQNTEPTQLLFLPLPFNIHEFFFFVVGSHRNKAILIVVVIKGLLKGYEGAKAPGGIQEEGIRAQGGFQGEAWDPQEAF